MKTEAKTVDSFIRHLHAQPGIDPSRTNHELILTLFSAYGSGRRQVTRYLSSRGTGVTTTLLEFAKWIDVPVLAVTRSPDVWRRFGIHVCSWTTEIRPMFPAPVFGLLDDPAGIRVRESAALTASFISWVNRFPIPALCVQSI